MLLEPTNKNLNTLFVNIDKVLIRDTSYLTKDFVPKVWSIDDDLEIKNLQKLLAIDESVSINPCMCHGDYQIDLYSTNELKATISFHHGESIRFEGWTNDATLVFGKELLELIKIAKKKFKIKIK